VGCNEIVQAFADGHVRAQSRRQDEPADPQCRGQRLADTALVDDAGRVERLERGHRRAVVAVLGVVVVLDDEPVDASRPGQQLVPTARVQQDAERELVRRGRHDHPTIARREGVDHQAVVVHRHRNGVEAVRGQQFGLPWMPGVLDRDPSFARRVQHLGQQRRALAAPW